MEWSITQICYSVSAGIKIIVIGSQLTIFDTAWEDICIVEPFFFTVVYLSAFSPCQVSVGEHRAAKAGLICNEAAFVFWLCLFVNSLLSFHVVVRQWKAFNVKQHKNFHFRLAVSLHSNYCFDTSKESRYEHKRAAICGIKVRRARQCRSITPKQRDYMKNLNRETIKMVNQPETPSRVASHGVNVLRLKCLLDGHTVSTELR